MAREIAATKLRHQRQKPKPAVHAIIVLPARRLPRIQARLLLLHVVTRNPRVARPASAATACRRRRQRVLQIRNFPDANWRKPCASNAASAAPPDRKNRHRPAVAARRKKALRALQAISPGKSVPAKPLADRPSPAPWSVAMHLLPATRRAPAVPLQVRNTWVPISFASSARQTRKPRHRKKSQ